MDTKSTLRQLLSAGLLVSGGILLGRITGFLRDVTVASQFGVSQDADIVLLSLTLPDFLINLLMGAAFAAALIPEFKRSTIEVANQIFLQTSLLVGLGFAFLAAVLVWNADHLVKVFAPGFDSASMQTTSSLLSIVLWLIPLTALAGITTSYLQAKNHFSVPAMGTFIFNITLVIALFFFVSDASDFKILGFAVLLGGLLRWSSQLICMGTQGMQWTLPSGWLVSKDLFWRYLQALAAGSLLSTLPVIARSISSMTGPGGFASMNYSIKLIDLPMGVCLAALASVLFPKLSEYFAQDRNKEAEQLTNDGILWAFIIAYSFVLVFIGFGQPLTQLAFQWGAMPAEGIQGIVLLISVGITALPAQGILWVLIFLSNAKKDTKLPFYCSLIGVIVFAPLAAFLFQRNGLQGIMMALVSSYWLILVVQIILLHQRHKLSIIKVSTLFEISKVLLTGFFLLLPFMWIVRTTQLPLIGSLGLALGAGALILAGGFLVIKRYRDYIIHRLGLRTHA